MRKFVGRVLQFCGDMSCTFALILEDLEIQDTYDERVETRKELKKVQEKLKKELRK